MPTSPICAALQRVESVMTEKPSLGLQADAPATAVLTGGLAFTVRHPLGHEVRTDMPKPLGGGGAGLPPGWLLRAGLASCTATVIALRAERLGVVLSRLEVAVDSHSDVRGLLGLDPCVAAGPLNVDMNVQIEAEGVSAEALADLVAWAETHSPVGDAMRRPIDVRMSINSRPPAAH